MKVHLYYDPYKAVTEHGSVLREVEKMEAELKEMETRQTESYTMIDISILTEVRTGSLASDEIRKPLTRH